MTVQHNKLASGLYITLIFLLGAMPVSIVTGHKLPSIIYYLSIFVSVVLFIKLPKSNLYIFIKKYKWLIIAMSMPLVTTLFAWIWNGFLSTRYLEFSSRILMGSMLLLAALQQVNRKLVSQSIWGYLIAGIASSIFIIYLSWPEWSRPHTSVIYNAVIYSNLMLALIIVCAFSFHIKLTNKPKYEFTTKIIITFITFIAFILTQTRTGWIAIPSFAIIAAALFSSKSSIRRIILLSAIFLVTLALIYVSNSNLRNRAVLAYQEVIECQGEGKNTNSSLCIRLQLWRASLDMALERPIAGTGDIRRFTETMQAESLPKGIVTPFVSKWWEPHSDLMLALASFGFTGALSLLIAYITPAFVFLRRMSFYNSPRARAAAAIGLAICITFTVAGFGDTMFRSMRIASFYAMTLAIFLRLSEPE